MKVTLSNKKGQAKQIELDETQSASIFGSKIGEKFDGSSIGLDGYELEVRGGSDSSGFPMRRDVQGIQRKRILAAGGLGVNPTEKGNRIRKTVAGNTVTDSTAQVNFYVIKVGKDDIFAPKEEVKEEANAEGGNKSA